MTLLRNGLFFSKSTWTPPVLNAAPAISSVTLNFDYLANTAPVGKNIGLEFEVVEGNAAPSISTVTLNFDFWQNTAPVGADVELTFEVIARNARPDGQDQDLMFEVAAA